MGQKGTEKDRIVEKNIIEGRRTDGNRQTDGDGRRMFENKFYVTPTYTMNESFMTRSCVFSAVATQTSHYASDLFVRFLPSMAPQTSHYDSDPFMCIFCRHHTQCHTPTTNELLWLICVFSATTTTINGTTNESLWLVRVCLCCGHTHHYHKRVIMTRLCVFCHHHH